MDTNTPTDPAELSFEAALAELEEIVRKLESGDAALEDSLALYERGAALRTQCEQKLKQAHLKVEKIVAQADKALGTEPLDPD